MKWSFAAIGLTILGLIGLSIVFLFEEITTNNESDYYLLKEVTEAAMIDSIDIGHYRQTGNLKIIKEKFVENFTRRYAESTLLAGTGYTISFYDIIEEPPKASIIISTGVTDYAINEDFSHGNDYIVKNYLDGILEFTGDKTFSKGSPYETEEKTMTYYFIAKESGGYSGSIPYPGEMYIESVGNAPGVNSISIKEVKYIGPVEDQGEINRAVLHTEKYFKNTSVKNEIFTYKDCEGSTGSASGSGNSVSISASNSKGKCAAIKFDVTWTYSKYSFSY